MRNAREHRPDLSWVGCSLLLTTHLLTTHLLITYLLVSHSLNFLCIKYCLDIFCHVWLLLVELGEAHAYEGLLQRYDDAP